MFSFCNPAQVRQQVILPVSSSRYKAADGVDIDDHVIFSESFRPKESLKAKQPESPRTQHQRLEEEIFLLTLDLFVSHAALLDFEQELLKKSSTYGGIIYQCQHAGATATSELVQQLRYTLQKYGQAIQSVSIKENKLSPIALKQLIELLRSYQEFSPSTKASSPYKGNCFTSIRHALIITDVFLTSCFDVCLLDMAGLLTMLPELKDLLVACMDLAGYISSDDGNTISLPFGQILLKYTTLLKYLSDMVFPEVDAPLTNNTQLANFIALMQAVASGLNILRWVCGDESLSRYLVTLRYWNLCERLLRDMSNSGVKEGGMFPLCLRKMQQLYISALPTAAEILFESKKLETLEMASVGLTDDYQLTMLLHDTLDILRQNKNISDGTSCEDKTTLAIRHLESKGLYSLVDKRSHLHFTLYSRFLLTGMLHMLHMPTTIHVIARVPSSPLISFPDKDKWFCSIYELLTFVLKEKVISAESRRLLPLAPFMAHMMLKISLSMQHDPSLDWIYWSLAKSLSCFNDWLRAATRSLHLQSAQEKSNKANNASMYSNAHSVSSASLRSLEPESARHRIALTATALSALDTPFKELNRESEYKPVASSKEHPKAAFQIGDDIDALYTLPNGTKRWFPGKVTGINEDLTFCILFDDGDIVPRQSAGDLRHTKKKRICEQSQAPPPTESITPLLLSFDSALSYHTLVNTPMPLHTHSPPMSMHALNSDLSLKNIPHVESEGEEEHDSEDSDEEDRVFEIPSIFDGLHRSNNSNKQHSNHREVVPRMQLTNLPMSSSLPHSASTPSLSGALLRDVEDDVSGDMGGEYDSGRVHNSIRGNSISPTPSLTLGSRHAVGSSTPYIHSHRSATHRSANNGITGNDLEDSLESSFSSLGAYSVKPISSARPNLAIGNFSEAVREESVTTGNTRMLSWRGEDSARAFTGRISARSNLHKPSAPLGEMMFHSAREVSSMANSLRQSKKTSSATNSSKEEQPVDTSILFHEFVYPYLLQTYALISIMVLKRCFVDKDNVDYACCISHVPTMHTSPSQSQISGMVDVKLQRSASTDQSINPLYHIREFLELCNSPELRLSFPSILSVASNADNLQRLCKMLHGCFFDNCLKDHMNTHSIKVGEGGFGSVFKVVCPEQCGRYKSFSHCYGCYKKTRGRSSSPRHKKSRQLSSDFVAQVTSAFSNFTPAKCMSQSHLDHVECQRAFAVKRIPRERSLYDQSTIFALYQEIAALEKLHNLIGVCGVEDYGVVSGEYWLVMEYGWCSLADWRCNTSSFKAFNPSPKHDRKGATEPVLSPNSVGEALARKEIAIFLMIFLDILYIVRDVHSNDVAHFDLKGSNFILREDPSHSRQHIWHCLQQNKSSGVVFLADFGEAIPHVSSVSDDSLRKRSRGTMAIQSPEMLCISESMGDLSSAMPVCAEDSISGHTDFSAPKRSSARRSFRISVPKDSHVSSFVSNNTSVHTAMTSDANLTLDSSTCKSKTQAFPVPSLSSDIWSLGCLLIELLSGNVLFHDRSWPELYTKLCLSDSHTAWAQDLECLAASLQCLDDDTQRNITDIALAAMHKDVKQRANIENLIVLTKSMLDKHFVNDIMVNREDGGGILTYSNSGDSQDDGRFNSHAIELNSLDHELPLKKVDEVDEEAGQLDDIARSLGMVSTEAFSVLQFQRHVWVGFEGMIHSLLTPFLGSESIKDKFSDERMKTKLTCQSLLNGSSKEDINANLLLPLFKVDELIGACSGTHAFAADSLSDILWHSCHHTDDSNVQPFVIWIKVSEAKEDKSTIMEKVLQAVSHKKVSCGSRVKIVNVLVPHTGSSNVSSLRYAVKDALHQIMGYCSDTDVPPILLISVEDNDALSMPDESEEQQSASSYRHIDKTVFSVALSVASMVSSTTNHNQVVNSSGKFDNVEALRLLGKLLRTMPWMDSLLDVYLVQDLVA